MKNLIYGAIKQMTIGEKITSQQEKIAKGNPKIKLVESCRLENGIDKLTEEQEKEAIRLFEKSKNDLTVTFFIPASGSGSRMFGDAYAFLNQQNPNEQTIEFIEHLINSIEEFAFYNKLPQNVKSALKEGTIEIDKFLKLILHEEGFNFGNRPKGLIPFHRYGNFIINPFQEHILQGTRIAGEQSRFHFTINRKFEDEIRHSIKILREITGIDFFFEFSEQDEATNSVAFDESNNPVSDENGHPITRPAGHGVLLSNLNQIESDLILIRNIDNIQHETNARISTRTRKAIAGTLLKFQALTFEILSKIDQGKDYNKDLVFLNSTYQLKIDENDFKNSTKIHQILNRPIRVCGMVKNEGQPGGGPFWVQNKTGDVHRQIVEKSQISTEPSQLNMLIKSTHFNPVEIVCATKNYKGEIFDLNKFKEDSQYFIVQKSHKGKKVQFIEQPGLWNGGMANWNTLFIEIDSHCFSPVKTVLDLLKPMHQSFKKSNG